MLEQGYFCTGLLQSFSASENILKEADGDGLLGALFDGNQAGYFSVGVAINSLDSS